MDPLLDPLKDRKIKKVKPPPHRPLQENIMFPKKGSDKPDWKLVRDHLKKEGTIAKPQLKRLIKAGNKILRKEGNLLRV